MYRARIMNEILFLQEIEEARNRRQPEQTDMQEQQDEEYPDEGPLDEYKERIAVMHKRGSHWEFKPEHNPYYTLLTSNDINEIKKALKIALYGFLICMKAY
jgi:SpoU rRNA methylase family enzyme